MPEVPRWYGDTIGFWDGDALITWTSNIQGWKVHGNPEFSGKLQTIEIYTPNRDSAGKFIGLNHEGVFYDPEALVEPIRMTRMLERISGFEEGDAVQVHRVRPDDLSDQRTRDAGGRREGDRIQGAEPVRPPVGQALGGVPREGHAAAEGERAVQVRLTTVGATQTSDRRSSDGHSARPWWAHRILPRLRLATPPPQGGAPTFRTGVNIVRVDVIVADDDGKPVTDLAKEEFEIIEDGRTQTIELFRHIHIESTQSAAPRPRQVLNRDTEEREAARDDVRVFGILLADYQVCGQRSRAVRDAMAAFIRKLGPNDLIAVMNPLMSVRDLVFTYDHDAVLQTIQRFEGRRGDYTPRNAIEEQHNLQLGGAERIRMAVVRDALIALSVRLGSMREGRKSLIFVGEGFPGSWLTDVRQLREVTQAANRHNTSIYAIDPRGLVAGGDATRNRASGMRRRPIGQRLRMTQDTLRELSDETDGRAIVDRNALEDGLNQILRDSSFYYLLGYSSTATQADGKFHQIRVRVKRAKVDVRARKGYWASTAEDASRAATPAPVTPQPVLDALAAVAAPNQDGRVIRTWVGTARGAGKGRVTVVSEVLAPLAPRVWMSARLTVTATRPQSGHRLREPARGTSARHAAATRDVRRRRRSAGA